MRRDEARVRGAARLVEQVLAGFSRRAHAERAVRGTGAGEGGGHRGVRGEARIRDGADGDGEDERERRGRVAGVDVLEKASGDESDVRWTFACKFLVDRDGNVVERNGDGAADNEAKIVKLLG